jgi:hypothetical protein
MSLPLVGVMDEWELGSNSSMTPTSDSDIGEYQML